MCDRGGARPYPVRTSLTSTSALDQDLGGPSRPNTKRSLILFVAAQVLLLGCVVPLPYEEEETATGDYPPIIRAAVPSMSFAASDPVVGTPPTWTLDVEDRNLDDTTYVRVFRDYNEDTNRTPPVWDHAYPPPGEALREQLEVNTSVFCPFGSTGTFLFEVIVADGPFDDSGTSRQKVSEGADWSIRAWRAVCP